MNRSPDPYGGLRRSWLSKCTGALLLISVANMPLPLLSATRLVVALKEESATAGAVAAVERAGSRVLEIVPQIGILEVEASNPIQFLESLAQEKVAASVAPSFGIPDLEHPRPEINLWIPAPSPLRPAQMLWNIERVTGSSYDPVNDSWNGGSFEIHQGTHDVVVAILEQSGIDAFHPALIGNVDVPGSRNYRDLNDDGVVDDSLTPTPYGFALPEKKNIFPLNGFESHGTLVGGVIAAHPSSDYGNLRGIAPQVFLRCYRRGFTFVSLIKPIIDAADEGADVINISLKIGPLVIGQWFFTDPETGRKVRIDALYPGQNAIRIAWERALRFASKTAVVVNAAANDFADMTNPEKLLELALSNLFFLDPGWSVSGVAFASAPRGTVVVVSGTGGGYGSADFLTSYSNYGQGVIDLAAPAGDFDVSDFSDLSGAIWSTTPTFSELPWCEWLTSTFGIPTCGFDWTMGTSFAAPAVAGVAALIISEEYQRTGVKPVPNAVISRMLKTADDIGDVGNDKYFGHGMVNACKALTFGRQTR